MFKFRIKTITPYIVILVVAAVVLGLLYFATANISQWNNSPLAVITIAASVFAILEALVTWLRHWQENNVRDELKEVIDALSKSSAGMDIYALERESKLPSKILQDRINELILLGRIGIQISKNSRRIYFLVAVVPNITI